MQACWGLGKMSVDELLRRASKQPSDWGLNSRSLVKKTSLSWIRLEKRWFMGSLSNRWAAPDDEWPLPPGPLGPLMVTKSVDELSSASNIPFWSSLLLYVMNNAIHLPAPIAQL